MQKNKLHTHNTASLPIIAPYIDTLKTHQIQIGISKIILLRKCAFSLDFYNPNFLLFEYWLRFGILKDHSLFMIGQAYTAVILRTEETG